MENYASLDDWTYAVPEDQLDGFTAPELIQPRIFGIVSNHRKRYGQPPKHLCLSHPIGRKVVDGKNILVTKHTQYILGEPHAEYKALYPRCVEELLAKLALLPADFTPKGQS